TIVTTSLSHTTLFRSKIGQASSRHLMMGLSMSALKGSYQEHAMYRAGGSAPRRTVTSYTFCFQVIVDWILRDIRIGRAANTEGRSEEHTSELQSRFDL